MNNLFGRAMLCAAITFALCTPVQTGINLVVPELQAASLGEVWEEFFSKAQKEAAASIQPQLKVFPGHHMGESVELAAFGSNSGWTYRQVTYEIYYDSSAALARSIYSIALLQEDVSSEMTLERFEKGVQGFHYSMEQIMEWARMVIADRSLVRTNSEQLMLDWLLADGIIAIKDGKAVDTGRVRHVLGAAPGKKRGFLLNLRHERLHAYWDENPDFSARAHAAWAKLDVAGREEVYAKLKGYSRENEAQIIEEWAVFEAENLPDMERIALVGI